MSADEEPLKHITFSAYGINIYNIFLLIFLLYQDFTFESLKSLKKKKKKGRALSISFDLLKNYCQTHIAHCTLYALKLHTHQKSSITGATK